MATVEVLITDITAPGKSFRFGDKQQHEMVRDQRGGCLARLAAWPCPKTSQGKDKSLREATDKVLFTLRLTAPGLFSLPCAQYSCCGYFYSVTYHRGLQTWQDSPFEAPLDLRGKAAEFCKWWSFVDNLRNLENLRLRHFAYLYFYPVAVDRFAVLMMAMDGLLHPKSRSCDSTFSSKGAALVQKAKSRRQNVVHTLFKFYKKRNKVLHGSRDFRGRDMEKIVAPLDDFCRRAIHRLLIEGKFENDVARQQFLDSLT